MQWEEIIVEHPALLFPAPESILESKDYQIHNLRQDAPL